MAAKFLLFLNNTVQQRKRVVLPCSAPFLLTHYTAQMASNLPYILGHPFYIRILLLHAYTFVGVNSTKENEKKKRIRFLRASWSRYA